MSAEHLGVTAASSASEPALEIRGLRLATGRGDRAVELLRGVDLSVAEGQVLGVVGESGSGKSLTALATMGLLPEGLRVTAGQVNLAGRDITTLSGARRRELQGAGLGMIYQEPMTALNPLMRVGRQVTEGLRAHGTPRQQAQQRAKESLERVGLPVDRAFRAYPHQLSGGMRQRAMIAVAVALKPRVLIADEPTTALDVTIQRQVIELVDELRREQGMAVMWITHDLGVVAHIAERTAVMYAGRVVEQGSTADLFAHPAHPYTAGLLASLPAPRGSVRTPLAQIGGLPPDPAALPPGCSFAPRCPQARDRCHAGEPEPQQRGEQLAACVVAPEEWSG